MSRLLNELFMASCGVFGQWGVSILRSERVIEERTFCSPYAFVGNPENTGVNLPDPQVRMRHAYLQVLPRGVFCVALDSRVGVRWGDEKQASGWLRPGQRVHIGHYALELRPTEQVGWLAPGNWPHDDPLAGCMSAAMSLPPFLVEVSEEGKILAQSKMNRVLALLGRSPRCLLHINNPGLSRFHCSLVRTPAGLWLIDLQNRVRTYLNGKRVRYARVREGDCVQLGRFSLLFRHADRKAWVIQKVVGGRAEVREGEWIRPTVVVRPSAEEHKPLPPPNEHSTALESARPAEVGTAAVAPPAMSPPNERCGAEWSMLVALVNQFNVMQQQMFDQFQESMLMTARMFTSLHQEQMAVVRDELDHLRGIAAELRALQEQLTGHQGQVTLAPGMTAQGGIPVNIGGAETAPTAGGAGPSRGRVALGQTAPGAANPPGKPLQANAEAAAAPSQSETPKDVHAWLNQRISALQEERQTRWHKLLRKILGN